MLTAERAREAFHYDQKTGSLTWAIPRPGLRAGTVAGCWKDGYLVVRLDGVLYRTHRLIWLIVTGAWPVADIDHRNGVRHDNRWPNLRDVPRSVNLQNLQGAKPSNKLGVLGVSLHRKSGRFLAAIRVAGKQVHLGLFDTVSEARAVRKRAEIERAKSYEVLA